MGDDGVGAAIVGLPDSLGLGFLDRHVSIETVASEGGGGGNG